MHFLQFQYLQHIDRDKKILDDAFKFVFNQLCYSHAKSLLPSTPQFIVEFYHEINISEVKK